MAATSLETQGQLVGIIECLGWKFTVRLRWAPGHLLLPNQFQKLLNCLLLTGQKKNFLANQRRGTAGWLWCFLIWHRFPHRLPLLSSPFNWESFSSEVSEKMLTKAKKFQKSWKQAWRSIMYAWHCILDNVNKGVESRVWKVVCGVERCRKSCIAYQQ